MQDEYEMARRDSVSGITSGRSAGGTYVMLDHGVRGFMPGVFLRAGLHVTCSVTDTRENGNFAFLGLDSVAYEAA